MGIYLAHKKCNSNVEKNKLVILSLFSNLLIKDSQHRNSSDGISLKILQKKKVFLSVN